jgi:hypothetical protein
MSAAAGKQDKWDPRSKNQLNPDKTRNETNDFLAGETDVEGMYHIGLRKGTESDSSTVKS